MNNQNVKIGVFSGISLFIGFISGFSIGYFTKKYITPSIDNSTTHIYMSKCQIQNKKPKFREITAEEEQHILNNKSLFSINESDSSDEDGDEEIVTSSMLKSNVE